MRVIKGESDSTHQYFKKSKLENYGVDLVFNREFKDKQGLFFKGSVNYFNRSLQTNYALQSGNQWNGYTELYYQIPKGRHNIIVGSNYLFDLFNRTPGDTSSYQNYRYHTGGIFAQYSFNMENRLNFQVGVRGDYQNKFGFFILPSAALLVHANKELSFRFNGGSGYKVPNILEIIGLEEGINAIPTGLNLSPERSYGGTVEWNYKRFFDKKGVSIFINQTFFYTWVQHAIITSQDVMGNYTITNVNQGATSLGVDNYIRIKKDPVEIYLGYTFTYPRKNYDKIQPYLTLTPLHRLATVVSVDITKHLKFGVEGSLYGRQYLDDGTRSKPYFFLASSLQYHIKNVTLVLNGENLLDVRQTRFGPVVYAPYTRPRFAQLWAPVDGVVVNFSIMVRI
jgi:outer membrane receptor for ferrienterochelin and colicin